MKTSVTPDLRVISLGGGVQSTAMYLLSAFGDLPKADYAVYALTADPPYVEQHLDYIESVAGHIIPIERVRYGYLENDPAALPLRVEAENGRAGFANRDCTRDYKVRALQRRVRELLGLRRCQRASGRYMVEQWLGISLDEAHRAKESREDWITLRYPLLFDLPMRRSDCVRWLEAKGFPVPRRSACYFCPFHSNAEWRALKAEPELWERVVAFDRGLRGELGVRGLWQRAYLHGSLVPIEEADLSDSRTADLFGNECEGMCGV